MSNLENRPLHGLTVIEFSQFLSGPYAGLRLADLGARVIKIERPGQGDLCRNIYISDTDLELTNLHFIIDHFLIYVSVMRLQSSNYFIQQVLIWGNHDV